MRTYDPGKAAAILELIAEQGLGLKAACERVGVPRRTVRTWATENPSLASALQLARREGYEHWADEILEIADSVRGSDSPAAVNAARLMVDSRKWLLSKLHPEQYGDSMTVTGKGGRDLIPVVNPATRVPRLMAVLAIAMPGKNNTELFELATRMIERVDAMETRTIPGNGQA